MKPSQTEKNEGLALLKEWVARAGSPADVDDLTDLRASFLRSEVTLAELRKQGPSGTPSPQRVAAASQKRTAVNLLKATIPFLDELKEQRDAWYREAKRTLVVQAWYANGVALQELAEWIQHEFRDGFNLIKKDLDEAYQAKDVVAFEAAFDRLERYLWSTEFVKRYKVTSKNRRFTPLEEDLLKALGRIYHFVIDNAREGARDWLKREKRTDAQNARADAASRRMKMMWGE